MAMNQDGRAIIIDSPVKDAFIVQSLSGSESICGLFEFKVDLLSDKDSIDPASLVGKAATLKIVSARADVFRYINGFVSRLASGPLNDDGLRRFQITLVPGLWLLTQGAHYRIFSQKNVADIIKEITSSLSRFMSVEFKTTGTALVREHVTQMGESDFDFITRIMEEEGYSYFFTHENGSHKMTVTNHANAFPTCAEGSLEFAAGLGNPYDAQVSSWMREVSFHTGTFKVTDYNDVTPDTAPLKTVKTVKTLPNMADHEREIWGEYQFPYDADAQHKFDTGHNGTVADTLVQAEECRYELIQGSSNAPTLCPGASFKLTHQVSSESGEYVVTRVHHQGSNEGQGAYSNSFECMPSKTIYRPQRAFPGRRVGGPLTAKVVELKATASGGDKTLLVKVQFPWISNFKTCWLRVSQLYAGNNWGSVFVPRVDQEVIVEFIDGNPDRPIITGALYNATHTAPPYTVTQSGIRTESSNYNELRFDDKKDSEEVYFQAGKDLNVLVKHDETRTVQNKHSTTVKESDHETTVEKGNMLVTVSKGDQETKVSKGKQTLTVQSDQSNTIHGNQKTDIGMSGTVTAKQSYKVSANQAIELKVGGSTLKMGPAEITLSLGANSIKIDPSGVTISGTMVKVNGSAMAEVKGGGMLTLKGGVTMIN